MSETKKTKILHITPHLGGGAGRVILNYVFHCKGDQNFSHQIISLDYVNDGAKEKAKNFGLDLSENMSQQIALLLKMISEADIILIHWWNHPLLYDFLVRISLPPCRLIIWSHVSGFSAPYVLTDKILNYSDIFVFSTPLSWQSPEVLSLSPLRQKMIKSIWSTAGVDYIKTNKNKEHKGFIIGYIGTVDYSKLHSDFLRFCRDIDIPEAKFVVCGEIKEKNIKTEAAALGIGDKIDFVGEVSDVNEYLSMFDVFGYPLNPNHYGTCDQVLAESMAAGIVPVVLANPMENLMVKDGETGLVADNPELYIDSIKKLYQDKALLARLSKNAKKYAVENFSLSSMSQSWRELFLETLSLPKSSKTWKVDFSREILPKDVFLESLGKEGGVFKIYCEAAGEAEKTESIEKIKLMGKRSNWKSETKGTVHHYASFFPDDEYLSAWSLLMR